MLNEPEVLQGTRAFYKTQELFAGTVDRSFQARQATVGWYDTLVDDNEGAFCLVNPFGEFADLVGDKLAFSYGRKTISVYCLGSNDLAWPIALARTAYFHLAPLNLEEALMTIRKLTLT